MKVRELIEKLKELDGELPVLRSGYEGGYTDVCSVGRPKEFLFYVNDAWYYGEHEEAEYYLGDKTKESGYAVVLS